MGINMGLNIAGGVLAGKGPVAEHIQKMFDIIYRLDELDERQRPITQSPCFKPFYVGYICAMYEYCPKKEDKNET
jgi:hypothetical protein